MKNSYHDNQKPARNRKCWQRAFVMVILVITITALPGCLKIMQQAGNGGTPASSSSQFLQNISDTPAVTSYQNISKTPAIVTSQNRIPPPFARYGDAAQYAVPAAPSVVPATMNPSSPDLVADALPEMPTDPYPGQHATQINTTTEHNPHVRYAEFKKTYVLRGNSTGLVVNATKLERPLWIHFDVKPLYDCIEDPESCRGEATKTISLPYFTLTVRDNQTREIVAEDGYGGVYSSQKINRTVQIYSEGRYHVTLTGNSVDVTLAISTGAAPDGSAMQLSDFGLSDTGSSKTKTPPSGGLPGIRGV